MYCYSFIFSITSDKGEGSVGAGGFGVEVANLSFCTLYTSLKCYFQQDLYIQMLA